jgi:hypothetical protein
MTFLIFSVIIFIIVTLMVPKKLPRNELYAIALFSIVIGFITDITLDLKYHVYGYFSPGVQFGGFLPILLLFPTSGILFMNFYPYNKKLIKKLIYICFWSIFCLLFEYTSVKSGYFYHVTWTYWCSVITYPFLLLVHLVHLKLYRRYNIKKSNGQK